MRTTKGKRPGLVVTSLHGVAAVEGLAIWPGISDIDSSTFAPGAPESRSFSMALSVIKVAVNVENTERPKRTTTSATPASFRTLLIGRTILFSILK